MKTKHIFIRLISLVLALTTVFCIVSPSFAVNNTTPADEIVDENDTVTDMQELARERWQEQQEKQE